MKQHDDAINIVDDDNNKIGTYKVARLAIDNPNLSLSLPQYELHVFRNDGTRAGMASVFENVMRIKNEANEMATFSIDKVPPVTFATQAAHVFLEHGDKPARELGENFLAEINNVAAGTHRKSSRRIGSEPSDN